MSYRELRNFIEIMRSLGYPRLISMENFRRPNFELVADILYWMVKLYDPDTTISDRVEFENERVEFLTGIANLMMIKARLKLNTKKIYASDGRAVQELLKLATLLYKATQTASKKYEEEVSPHPIKIQDVKAARVLASDITQSGATLYDLLETEAVDRLERARALRFLDQAASTSDGPKEQAFIERSIREIIENTKQALEDMRKECEELDADERNIESKIQKKQEELERTEKRLKSLENVKPQFMEEAEKLEKDLQKYYDIYMEKHRNLDYLEHELDKYRHNEEERMAEHERRLKKMRERLLKEEVDLMRGGARQEDDKERYNNNNSANRKDYNGGSTSREGRGGAGAQVQGKAKGRNRDDDTDEDSSEEDSEPGARRVRGGGGGGGGGRYSDEEVSVNHKSRGAIGNRGTVAARVGGGRSADSRNDDASEDFLDDDDDDGDEDDDEDDDGDDGAEFSGGSDGDF